MVADRDLAVHPGTSLVSQMQPPSSFPEFFGQVIAAASLAVFQPQSSYPAGGHQMSHQADGVSSPYPGDPNIMTPSQVSPNPLRTYQSSSPLAGLPESLSRLNFANLQGTQGGPPSWSSTEMGTRNSMVNGGHAGPNPDAFHRDNTTHQERGQRKRKADETIDYSDTDTAGKRRKAFDQRSTQDLSTLESLS